ncbi:hypothetical protein CYLTODRAFT_446681 [Cylindrobasidium torrendii FP15055 ss-10]|uniref:HSF-type DNA-binding domain-containing protein n=1 Tax=Cylindrobasidium torrendii FP15055 ss-10 TaxID=1314674 RepID=A0A0D7B1D6_9AGAR|nr:hypothetical protein CYLTODRAFT_446681 [Cylindrobasidium torrendii FP15055 ss-10]
MVTNSGSQSGGGYPGSSQVALSGGYSPSSFRPFPAKVPMFLQKLYTILEDPTTDQCIVWADDGCSFYVYDQEAFAQQHLPQWFKHNKFASFVRQLNMYGFHKIPHLQQGLISDADAVQFMHPYFQRGREDQLAYIERKKQAKDLPQDVELTSPPPSESSGSTPATAFDPAAIVDAINSIRRTQTQITQELNELRQTDRIIWDEATRSHQRYEQQQETIGRIVKFLASLLNQIGANSGDGMNLGDRGASSSQSSAPSSSRYMIEDRTTQPRYRVSVVEVEDEDTSARKSSQKPIVQEPSSGQDASAHRPYHRPIVHESPSGSTPADFSSPVSPDGQQNLSSMLNTALTSISSHQDWTSVLSAFPEFLTPSKLVYSPSSIMDGLLPLEESTSTTPQFGNSASMPAPVPTVAATSSPRSFLTGSSVPSFSSVMSATSPFSVSSASTTSYASSPPSMPPFAPVPPTFGPGAQSSSLAGAVSPPPAPPAPPPAPPNGSRATQTFSQIGGIQASVQYVGNEIDKLSSLLGLQGLASEGSGMGSLELPMAAAGLSLRNVPPVFQQANTVGAGAPPASANMMGPSGSGASATPARPQPPRTVQNNLRQGAPFNLTQPPPPKKRKSDVAEDVPAPRKRKATLG